MLATTVHAASETSSVAPKHTRPATLPALTGIRALLAWLVVGFHFSQITPFGDGGDSGHPPLSNGPYAVDCFFILSGFILFHVHPELGRSPGRQEIGRFLRARMARLYPVHLVMLLLFAASVWGLWLLKGVQPNEPIRFSGSAFLEHLLLLHGWGITSLLTWNYPSWSVSSEWAAYLAAPVLFTLAARLPARTVLPVAMLVGLILAMWLDTGEVPLRLSVPRVMLGFGLGILLCRLRDLHNSRLLRVQHPMLMLLWPAFLATLLLPHGGLIGLAFAALMLFHGLEPPARPVPAPKQDRVPALVIARLSRLAIYLGETSYAVYMCHAFIEDGWLTLSAKLHLFGQPNPIAVGLAIMLSVQLFAMLLHHGVEEPGRRLLRR